MLGGEAERRRGVVAVDAGLAAVRSLEARVSERRHVDVDARGHRGHRAHAGRDLADPAQLVQGVDHEGAHAAGDRAPDLVPVLATPLNTICRGAKPTASALSSSPPALTSMLLPAARATRRTHRLEQALLA